MNRALPALTMVVSLIAGRAHATDIYPTLSGTTTITSAGSAGVRFSVTQDAGLADSAIRLSLLHGTAAFALIGPKPGTGNCRGTAVQRACLWAGAWTIPASSFPSASWSTLSIHAGLLDVYIVTDGAAILELKPTGLSGSTSVEATASIDGVVEQLPHRCGFDDCQRFGNGGATHDIGALGFAAVHGYVSLDDEVDLGPAGSQVCQYPEFAGDPKTADPQTHPNGCDHPGDVMTPTGLLRDTTSAVYQYNGLWGEASTSFRYDATGPLYLGWSAHAIGLTEQRRMGGYGLWLQIGMACPSGDFTACHA